MFSLDYFIATTNVITFLTVSYLNPPPSTWEETTTGAPGENPTPLGRVVEFENSHSNNGGVSFVIYKTLIIPLYIVHRLHSF